MIVCGRAPHVTTCDILTRYNGPSADWRVKFCVLALLPPLSSYNDIIMTQGDMHAQTLLFNNLDFKYQANVWKPSEYRTATGNAQFAVLHVLAQSRTANFAQGGLIAWTLRAHLI